MKKIAAIGLGALLILGAAGAVWMNRQFEEPGAEEIVSLAGHLKASSVLAIFAHPDDEIVAAGAISEAASREGTIVRMITATRGEAGIPDESVCRPEDLGIVRHAELLKHGYQLGVVDQQVWQYPDGGVPEETEALTIELVEEIRSLRPDLILTFDPTSGYTYHKDHRAVGRAATRARELAAAEGFRPDLGAPHSTRWLARAVVPRRLMGTFGGERGEKIVQHQVAPRYAMSIDTRVKTRAWSIHQSQAGHMRRDWGVPPWLLYLLFDKEHFAVDGFPEM